MIVIFLSSKGMVGVKIKASIEMIISIIMLIPAGYLLINSSITSLSLLSNPNLNVANELIRLFWGITGTGYFLFYLVKNLITLFLRQF